MREAVVDSSTLIDTLVTGSSTRESRDLVAGFTLHAPHLVGVEVMSWLRRLTLAGKLHPSRAQMFFSSYASLPIQRHQHDLFLPRVWELRANFTAYDALYVALAEALDVPLVTRDRRLAAAARDYCDVVIP